MDANLRKKFMLFVERAKKYEGKRFPIHRNSGNFGR
jgi:hypothetical protein